jgi:hypothetical protein
MDKNLLIKIFTGLLIVPIAVSAHFLWKWWMKTSKRNKIISSIFVLPIVGLAAILTPWWDGY